MTGDADGVASVGAGGGGDVGGAPALGDGGRSEFVRLLGVAYDEVTARRVTGEYDADARHHQPMGIVHGGVHTAVIEQTASTGAYMAVRDRGLVAVGVANVCDFVRPHRAGRLRVVAEPVHVGATQQLWQAEVTRVADGALVARGQVRLANIALRDTDDPADDPAVDSV